jgi:hypothetical protein
MVLLGGAKHRPGGASACVAAVPICLTGKSVRCLSSPIFKNIPVFAGPKSPLELPPSRPTEGRFAIVTDAGRDAVDASALLTNSARCGRRSRVVLMPRRWHQVGGIIFADDGGKQARSPGRARRKPLKPLRGECRAFSGVTVVTNARAFYHYTRGCVRIGRPAFPAPSDWQRAERNGQTSRKQAARSRTCILTSFARSDVSAVAQRAKAEATKQSTLSLLTLEGPRIVNPGLRFAPSGLR